MAENTLLSKVEDQLSCSICLDTYADPKLLQCFHEFCRKCLVKLVDRNLEGQLFISCPICRQDTPVPATGVRGLQPAFRINHLLEIITDEHRKVASLDSMASSGSEMSGLNTSSLTSLDPPKNKISCDKHGGKEAELYCETCEELICWKCALRGGEHHSHNYEELDKAFDKYKVEIAVSLEPLEKQLTSTKKALAQLDSCRGEITDQQVDIEANIHKTFGQIQEILNVRKTKLIHRLHQLTQGKLKDLAVQRDEIETKEAQLNSCLAFMKESLKADLNTDSQGEVLRMKKNVVKQVKELSAFPADMLRPNTEANILFSASTDISSVCKNYGHVVVTGSPDPSKCLVTGSIERAMVGEIATAILHTVDFERQPCEMPILSSECELVSEITGVRTSGSIVRRHDQYQINYQPTVKGRHQLHIKLDNQHVRGSPFTVTAKTPVEGVSSSIRLIDGLERPAAVVLNQMGEVVLTEWDAHYVSVFSPSGEKLLSFGTRGSDEGQFIHPSGIGVDGEGNILVADWGNNRIQKFSAAGQFLAVTGSKGNGQLQFDSPYGCSFNLRNNKLYVTDNNHRVQVLNSDLTFSSIFGKHGTGKGQFDYPRGIAFDSTGNVYVADRYNHRIQVFTPGGKFVRMFGKCGELSGELYYPIGVAIDKNDTVYVGEYSNQRVSVFTSDGVFVSTFGDYGKQLASPCGVCVDSFGVVYVCDKDKYAMF